MQYECFEKQSFCVIGLPGSTEEGEGFVQRLWREANARFGEIAHLARRDAAGKPAGIWGAMSDVSLSFRPWEDGFTRGLYLAGVEVEADALPPAGWTKWTVPGFAYLRVACEGEDTFARALKMMREQGWTLAGAVQDFTDAGGRNYQCFPLRRL